MKIRNRSISFIMAACIILTNINIGFIHASTVNSTIYKDNNCEIIFKVNSQWDTGFEGQIILTNSSDKLIKDWKITFDLPYEINTIWDGEIKAHNGNRYSIQPKQYNNEIKAGAKVIIGFTAARKGSSSIVLPGNVTVSSSITNNENPDKDETLAVPPHEDSTDGLDDDDSYKNFSIRYKVTSQWENEYNMEVTIQNNGENTIENWRLSFNLEDKIQSVWNAKIESSEDNYYIIKNDGWNQDIKPDKKVKFAFTAKFKDLPHEPENAEMNSVCLEVPEKDYIVQCSSADGKTAKVQIKNLSDKEIEDWKISIPNLLKITNIWDAEISSQDNDAYYINNAGYNSSIKAGGTVEFGFNFSGTLPDNKKMQLYQMKLYNINDFIKDKDGDGISDDIETKDYGTSPDKADTDGDGLSDYYEIFVSGTDPLKAETQKGIKDSDLDTDEDGLTIIKEAGLGTDPLLYDTDFDGLSDSEEVNIYRTSPLLYDTDYDGLSDYDEIILGLDPLNKDTGGKGIPDSEKVVKQTITEEIEDGRGINKVEIVLNAKGNAAQDIFIDEVYDISDISSNKALLGAPIEIELDSDIKDAANIKIHFDSSIVKKVSDPDNLILALYDEDKQICKILTSTLNIKDGIISTETKKFGQFCLMDKDRLPKKVLEKGSQRVPNAREIKKISKDTLKKKLKKLITKEQGWKRNFKKYSPEKCVDVALKYEKQAETVSKKVNLPKEYVLAILFRELVCYDLTDDAGDIAVMNYFYHQTQLEMYKKAKWHQKLFMDIKAPIPMREDCSTGLGQIFCNTAIKSNNYAVNEGLLSGKNYKLSNWKHRKKIWYKLKDDNIYNVTMAGYVLRWGANEVSVSQDKFKTPIGAKKILARYNGTGSSATGYGKIVYRYYKLFKRYYK